MSTAETNPIAANPAGTITGGATTGGGDPRVLFMLDDPPQTGTDASVLASSVRRADPSDPQISVLDLAVTRGDGIFETLDAIDGFGQALEPHLARLPESGNQTSPSGSA